MLLISGRSHSGKSTLQQIAEEVNPNVTLHVCRDVNDLARRLGEFPDAQVVYIDAPLIHCYLRSKEKIPFSAFVHKLANNRMDDECLQKYVTELPNVTIIKNNESLDHFRRNVKNFLSKY